MEKESTYVIYTDASFDDFTKIGTYSIIIMKDNKIKKRIAKRCRIQLNNATEMHEAKEMAQDFYKNNYQEHIIDIFMKILDKKINEAKDMLLERFEWIASRDPSSAKFMYENGLMAGYIPEEGIRSALKHGTLAMGQLGLAETL